VAESTTLVSPGARTPEIPGQKPFKLKQTFLIQPFPPGGKRQIDMILSHRGTDPLPTCQNPPPTGPPPESCLSLFKSMPSEDVVQSFGQRGSNADVEVPRALRGGKSASLLYSTAILNNGTSGRAMCSHAEY
jgi:hypothetical protein